jgi:hypothetical protein
MIIEGDEITFSSGRTAYANCGIVGIGPELNISHGYDGDIDWPPLPVADALTTEDMRELADHMIATWKKFKKGLKP